MTISQAYERLLAGPVTQIDWNDGGELRCELPTVVHDLYDNVNAAIWLEASEEGLCLHFNARDRYGEMHGCTKPLSKIARIL